MDFEDGEKLVLKTGAPGAGLDLEGYMLQYLASHSDLPVPEVFCANDDLLIMAYINAGSSLTPAAQEHAADCWRLSIMLLLTVLGSKRTQ